ncbi:hypothetical protein PFISCL1PPCAC_21997, partial [Pristionchus fissidentatus]
VEDVSKLTFTRNRVSPATFIQGMPCWITAVVECTERTDNKPYLSFYVYCNEDSGCNLWSAEVTVSLTLLNADPTNNITPLQEAPRIRFRISGIYERCDFADRRKESLRQQALSRNAFTRFRFDVLPRVQRKRKIGNHYGGYLARRIHRTSPRNLPIVQADHSLFRSIHSRAG